MDQRRSRRNQELIHLVRDGQAASSDLSIYEDGFVRSMMLADLCSALSDPSVVQMLDLDASNLFGIADYSAKLRQQVVTLRAKELQDIGDDLGRRCLLCVADNGFRRVCHNLDCVSRWGVGPDLTMDYLGEAANVLKIKAFIRHIRLSYGAVMQMGERARDALVEENRDLMAKVAMSVSGGRGERFEELMSVAAMQFVHCMDESYDVSRPTLFSTYAFRCMTDRCRQDNGSPRASVHIPQGQHATLKSVLSGELDVDASDVMDPDRRSQEAGVRRTLLSLSRPVSLDAPVGEDGDRFVYDAVSDGTNEIEAKVDELAVLETLRKVRDRISAKSFMVLEGRVGVGQDQKSLDRLASDLLRAGHVKQPTSRQRVGQILIAGRDKAVRTLHELCGEYLTELGVRK